MSAQPAPARESRPDRNRSASTPGSCTASPSPTSPPGSWCAGFRERRASDLALPGNDFWLFDDDTVYWNHFTGDGVSAGGEVSEDSAAVKLCAEAFEAVWSRAVPHDQYEIH